MFCSAHLGLGFGLRSSSSSVQGRGARGAYRRCGRRDEARGAALHFGRAAMAPGSDPLLGFGVVAPAAWASWARRRGGPLGKEEGSGAMGSWLSLMVRWARGGGRRVGLGGRLGWLGGIKEKEFSFYDSRILRGIQKGIRGEFKDKIFATVLCIPTSNKTQNLKPTQG